MKTKKGEKRKSGESSKDKDEIETDNNTYIIPSNQEEGLGLGCWPF